MVEIPLLKDHAIGFVEFIRERGVVGLAIGFVMGTAVQKVVTAFVNDMVNPIINIVLGGAKRFETFAIGPFEIGDFASTLLNFIILVLVVYYAFKITGLDRIDKKSDE